MGQSVSKSRESMVTVLISRNRRDDVLERNHRREHCNMEHSLSHAVIKSTHTYTQTLAPPPIVAQAPIRHHYYGHFHLGHFHLGHPHLGHDHLGHDHHMHYRRQHVRHGPRRQNYHLRHMHHRLEHPPHARCCGLHFFPNHGLHWHCPKYARPRLGHSRHE
ncbi:hypothetical protein GQ53DRAFT_465158 [Thozetella sp. PMI_491]|nr:hypothetical protein GQ53DRAFT_465158 [Thozetella sp. PMI_491]